MKVSVKIVNKSHHALPSYSTLFSTGMDIRANLSEPVVLAPLERKLIPTGLYIALPEGYEAQIRPRSGLALKHGITIPNTPGTIDADYRGEGPADFFEGRRVWPYGCEIKVSAKDYNGDRNAKIWINGIAMPDIGYCSHGLCPT